MKVFLDSVGCRLNQSEIEQMARQLLAGGHEIVSDVTQAEKIILNTCAVTAEATRDVRRLTRRWHRQNGAADLFLTGCYATIAPQEVQQLPGVTYVVANKEKEGLVGLLDAKLSSELPVYDQEPILRQFFAGKVGHTRAFVKVQDGCDNHCTFCITTVARGVGHSRHLGDVVAEIQARQAAGCQEAVLTGVHLGSYGHDWDNKAGLQQLVEAILQHTDIPRLRLSSLEPWDITPDFFALWQNPRLLPHLHLPLQSGSDSVLKRMARRTRCKDFRELVAAARSQIPFLNLSTDLIVGFPGETEKEFQQGLEFVQEMAFARLHVFSYSPRAGTAAATMPNQLAPSVKQERTQQLIRLGQELSLTFHQQFVQKQMNVLWEGVVGADDAGIRWMGYSDNYIRVTAYGQDNWFNRILPIRLHTPRPDGMMGQI